MNLLELGVVAKNTAKKAGKFLLHVTLLGYAKTQVFPTTLVDVGLLNLQP